MRPATYGTPSPARPPPAPPPRPPAWLLAVPWAGIAGRGLRLTKAVRAGEPLLVEGVLAAAQVCAELTCWHQCHSPPRLLHWPAPAMLERTDSSASWSPFMLVPNSWQCYMLAPAPAPAPAPAQMPTNAAAFHLDFEGMRMVRLRCSWAEQSLCCAVLCCAAVLATVASCKLTGLTASQTPPCKPLLCCSARAASSSWQLSCAACALGLRWTGSACWRCATARMHQQMALPPRPCSLSSQVR